MRKVQAIRQPTTAEDGIPHFELWINDFNNISTSASVFSLTPRSWLYVLANQLPYSGGPNKAQGRHHCWSNLTLGQAVIRGFFDFRCVDINRFLPCLSGVDLLGHLQELVLRDFDVLDVHESVLGLLRVTQDTDDSLSYGIQRGGAEYVFAAVEELGLSLLPVE